MYTHTYMHIRIAEAAAATTAESNVNPAAFYQCLVTFIVHAIVTVLYFIVIVGSNDTIACIISLLVRFVNHFQNRLTKAVYWSLMNLVAHTRTHALGHINTPKQ